MMQALQILSQAIVKALAKSIADSLTKSNQDIESYNDIGFVWSNAVDNIPLNGTGISAIVTAREKYAKNEWFIEDLENGRDLGKDMLEAFKSEGFDIETIIITNDTPLTLKALDLKADAGMVASTGSNGTVLKTESELGISNSSEKKLVCNAEIGGRFDIPTELLSVGDKVYPGDVARKIEKLSSGRFIRQIFTEHILLLDFQELKELQSFLRSLDEEHYNLLKAQDLGHLLVNHGEFIKRRTRPELFTPEVLKILESLSREIINRASLLCAVTAYASVANMLESKSIFEVAVDSRLSREMPYFWERFQFWMEEITPSKKQINLHLIEAVRVANGSISIPMIGVARAIDCI